MKLKHIIASDQISDPAFLDDIFARAQKLEQADQDRALPQALQGKIIACLFYEPSTRTRLSFEAAVQKLGGTVIGAENAMASSSAVKGETLEDTIKVVSAYADAIVIRHPEPGSAAAAAAAATVPVINAGDGGNEHPTQALLDMYTIKKEKGTIANLHVAFGFDPLHSRTIRSLALMLAEYPGMKFCFISPPSLQAPRGLLDKIRAKNIPVTESEEINDGLSADIFYTNRLQQERFADPEEFEQQRKKLTLTADMLSSHSVLVMDPLPRVDEIHPSVDNLPNALYFKQAKNGLYARMALLEYLLAG